MVDRTTNRCARVAIACIATCLTIATSSEAAQDTGGMQAKMQARIKEAAAAETPRTADGHPDLSGYWQMPMAMGGGGDGAGFGGGPDTGTETQVFGKGADVATVNARMRAAVAARRANTSLRPKYKKPEDTAKALKNFDVGDRADPTYGCQLPGVTRVGLPSEIYQRPGSVALLYEGLVNRFRVVPTDGRKLEADLEPVPMGYPVGRWEGETLVIETTGFVPDNWIDRDGSFHSGDLRVVERFTRRGNTLQVEVVAHDSIFAEPFKVTSRTLVLAPPGRHIDEEYPCIERSIDNMVNGEKH